jgi:anaerobic magnesium-protoporphyrin IX monomethyl ester cyclase
MKILLIQTWLGRKEKPIYPLGLSTLAGDLTDHEVHIIDPNVLPDPWLPLEEELIAFQPEVVGLSLRNVDTTQFRDPFVYLKTLQPTLDLVKRLAPSAIRIIGGSGFSVHAEAIMQRFPDLQIGIPLEGDLVFPELLKQLHYSRNTEDSHCERSEATSVAGIYIRKEKNIHYTGPASLPGKNHWSEPRWDLWDPKQYIHESATIGIQTKRGCALSCVYCTYGYLNGKCYRFREPLQVVDEIQKLWEKFGVPEFMFVDSVFNFPRDHAEAICHELIRRELPVRWSAWLHEKYLNRDFLELMVDAGCYEVSFSPDGYTDSTLKSLGKGMTKADVQRGYELVKEFPRLRVGYNFFINPPGQTSGGFLSLMGFFLKARWQLRGRWNGFLLGKIRIEPHTVIYDQALEEGSLRPDINLLPESESQLLSMFYQSPNHHWIETLYKGYVSLWKFKHRHDVMGN